LHGGGGGGGGFKTPGAFATQITPPLGGRRAPPPPPPLSICAFRVSLGRAHECLRGTSRADSRRSGVGLAPGPQALLIPAVALVLFNVILPSLVRRPCSSIPKYLQGRRFELQPLRRLGSRSRGLPHQPPLLRLSRVGVAGEGDARAPPPPTPPVGRLKPSGRVARPLFDQTADGGTGRELASICLGHKLGFW
jgi:hypothetical protein